MLIDYIFEFLKYSIFFAVLYLIIKIIYCRIKKVQFNQKKELLISVYFSYIFGLFSQTIFPIINYGFIGNKPYLEFSVYNNGTVNLIPFKTIRFFLENINNINGIDTVGVSKLNLLANIGLFIPFGLLTPFFIKNKKFMYTYILGILLSLFIEVMQIFVKRGTDIDDFILNNIGVLMGVLFYYTINSFIFKKYNNN